MKSTERKAPVRRRASWIKRLAALAFTWAACGLLLLLIGEVAYRYQVMDTYVTELRTFNTPEELADSDRPTLLVMGDSLTAGRGSYPDLVREARPDLRVINAGLPGTGVIQSSIAAPARFREFRPDLFVYQLNVSNDLLNVRWPISWRHLSPQRNLYWTLAQRFRSLEFLNYRLGQLAFVLRSRKLAEGARPAGLSEVGDAPDACTWEHATTDIAMFAPHTRSYLRGQPSLFEHQILLRDKWRDAFDDLLERLPDLLDHCDPATCRVFLLVVPDVMQVDARYLTTMERVGSKIENPHDVLADDYPFLEGLREWVEAYGRTNVRVLDPLPALREAEAEGTRVFFQYDPHLNGCGQDVLARSVLEALDAIPR